MEKVPQPLAYD
ncbi:hypothetical protein Tco_0700010, partial [Tanacetum coccineum]